MHTTCSPDGKWVYYTDLDSYQVKRVTIDGGNSEVVEGTVMQNMMAGPASLSVDGKTLAFFATKGGDGALDKKLAQASVGDGSKHEVRMLDSDRGLSHT